MKLYFASMYLAIITITITVLLMFFIGRNKSDKAVRLKNQLKLILAMDVVCLLSFFTDNYRIYTINYGIVLILEVIVIRTILNFSYRYSKINFKYEKPLKNLFRCLTILDIAIILINICTGYFYSFESADSVQYGLLIRPEVNAVFLSHIVYCVFMEILLSMMMFRNAFRCKYVFKRRYMQLGTAFLAGLVLCSAARIFTGFLNYPAALLLTVCEGIIFYSYLYLPRDRMNVMKDFVISNVSVPLLMFDRDDELQVVNEPARQILKVEKGMSLDDFAKRSNLKYILTKERRSAGKTREFTMTTKINLSTYLIDGQELREKNGQYVGMLFIYHDISRQEALKDEATYHATRDSLTGLWNREYFLEIMENTLSDNPDEEYILLISDICQFKLFNDILGKSVGDDLILSITEGFYSRKMPGWFFARIGVDRFALMMPYKDYDEKRFIDVCNSVIAARGYGLTVHYYLSAYIIRDRKKTADVILNSAEMVLEDARDRRMGVIAYYDESLHERLIVDAMSEEELAKALKEKQFEIYLQPQTDIMENKIVGAEALVRWNHPQRGMVSPNEFIPMFEETGMINELDYYVWEEACKLIAGWEKEGGLKCSISVNISAKDFYLSNIYSNITGLVEKYGINPKKLKLEITETAFALNVTEQAALVKQLQDYGFIVEIDDFGSGYSSLNSLKDIPADVLKLDMKFFERTDDAERAQKVVESIVNLAYNLKMPVIAEGVEDDEKLELLKAIGCRIVQGFYYSRPLPVKEFEKYAKSHTFEDIDVIIDELHG